jgi:hypothetical protein
MNRFLSLAVLSLLTGASVSLAADALPVIKNLSPSPSRRLTGLPTHSKSASR